MHPARSHQKNLPVNTLRNLRKRHCFGRHLNFLRRFTLLALRRSGIGEHAERRVQDNLGEFRRDGV